MNAPKILAFALFVAGSASSQADNAALTSGGLPKMMAAHPSIAMESEVVKMVIHGDRVETDCTFVFANHGKACKVQMGFPDFGLWAFAYTSKKPQTMFRKYRSYVDGKSVATKLVLGEKPGEQWQTKTVSFPANGKRIVREVYTTDVGGIALAKPIAFASYILHTGASWKGNIGKATILITVDKDTGIADPLSVSYSAAMPSSEATFKSDLDKPGGVLVTGVAAPTIAGRTLRIEKSNWRPTIKDDILVAFYFSKEVLDRMRKAAHTGGK